MTSSTKQIVEALMEILEGTGLYKQIGSAIEDEPPKVLKHPAAFVFFGGDQDPTTGARPAPDMELGILIFNRNLRSKGKAAEGTYDLLDTTRDAINGKRGGLTDIEPFRVAARNIHGFEAGEISYEMTVRTGQKLPVVTME